MKRPTEVSAPLTDRELKLKLDAYEQRRIMRKRGTDKLETFSVTPSPSLPGGFNRVVMYKGGHFAVHAETYRLYPVRLRWEVSL